MRNERDLLGLLEVPSQVHGHAGSQKFADAFQLIP